MKDEKFYEGTVIWFNNDLGYGFIDWSKNDIQQKDLFCHWSDLVCSGFKTLKKEQRVSFSMGTNNRGEPKAINVEVVRK